MLNKKSYIFLQITLTSKFDKPNVVHTCNQQYSNCYYYQYMLKLILSVRNMLTLLIQLFESFTATTRLWQTPSIVKLPGHPVIGMNLSRSQGTVVQFAFILIFISANEASCFHHCLELKSSTQSSEQSREMPRRQ